MFLAENVFFFLKKIPIFLVFAVTLKRFFLKLFRCLVRIENVKLLTFKFLVGWLRRGLVQTEERVVYEIYHGVGIRWEEGFEERSCNGKSFMH